MGEQLRACRPAPGICSCHQRVNQTRILFAKKLGIVVDWKKIPALIWRTYMYPSTESPDPIPLHYFECNQDACHELSRILLNRVNQLIKEACMAKDKGKSMQHHPNVLKRARTMATNLTLCSWYETQMAIREHEANMTLDETWKEAFREAWRDIVELFPSFWKKRKNSSVTRPSIKTIKSIATKSKIRVSSPLFQRPIRAVDGTRICLGYELQRKANNRTYMGSTHKLDRHDLAPIDSTFKSDRYDICDTSKCPRLVGEFVQFLEPLEARVAADRKKIEDIYQENRSKPWAKEHMERALTVWNIEERERMINDKKNFIADCIACHKDQCRTDEQEKAREAAMGITTIKK